MQERNRLINGRFLHRLDGWTASGATYSAGDGDEHYGVAVLATGGGWIEQQLVVTRARVYTLHLAVKAVGADLSAGEAVATLRDDRGNTVASWDLAGEEDTWTENTFNAGLAPGGTYFLRIENVAAAGDVKIDDVWLWWVPMTRAAMAARVAAKLARLASDRGLSTTPAGALTEGHYTYAVDAGLRSAGAINPETDLPDVRYLESNQIDLVLDLIEREVLEQLERDYAVEVDLATGDHRESHSQKAGAIARIRGAGVGPGGRGVAGGGRVGMGRLIRS